MTMEQIDLDIQVNDERKWPNADQHREQLKTGIPSEDRHFKQTKWVWSSTGKSTFNGYPAEKRRCLGIFQCTSCKRPVRPLTRGYNTQFGKSCSLGDCQGHLEHFGCETAVSYHYDVLQDGKVWMMWDHVGHHNHPKPPVGVLDEDEKDKVFDQVARSQSASAYQLRIGDGLPGSVPLSDIAPSLAGARSARYHVSQAKANLGISPSKSSSTALHIWKDLEKKLDGPFIIDSRLHGSIVYLVIQSPWMKQMLQASIDMWSEDYEVVQSAATRHSSITNGDHSFFRNGTLLTTCVFSPKIVSWVPVLYTYMDALDTGHHRPHFRHLFKEIQEHAGSTFEPKMLMHICFVIFEISYTCLIEFFL